jgi:hypothetical protein
MIIVPTHKCEEDVIFNIIAIVKVIFKMKRYLESIASFTEVRSFTCFVVSVIMWHIVAEYGLEGCVGSVTQHEFFWKFKFGLIVRSLNLFLFFFFWFDMLRNLFFQIWLCIQIGDHQPKKI